MRKHDKIIGSVLLHAVLTVAFFIFLVVIERRISAIYFSMDKEIFYPVSVIIVIIAITADLCAGGMAIWSALALMKKGSGNRNLVIFTRRLIWAFIPISSLIIFKLFIILII